MLPFFATLCFRSMTAINSLKKVLLAFSLIVACQQSAYAGGATVVIRPSQQIILVNSSMISYPASHNRIRLELANNNLPLLLSAEVVDLSSEEFDNTQYLVENRGYILVTVEGCFYCLYLYKLEEVIIDGPFGTSYLILTRVF